MSSEKKSTLSYLEKLKQKSQDQKSYGGEAKSEEARMEARDCPNCGAGRAYRDGLTHCAYCGFEFISGQLTDGLHIKKENQ